MKYVMDRIPNYDKNKRINFERFQKTIDLLYDVDKSKLDAAVTEFQKHYGPKLNLNQANHRPELP